MLQVPWPDYTRHYGLYKDYIRNTVHADDFIIYEDIGDRMDINLQEALERLYQLREEILSTVLKLTVKMSTRTMVTQFADIPAVSLEGFVGSLGGILNLWVGLSFITIIELVELCVNIVYKGCNRNRVNKGQT